jgi:site-specific DNA recombinase
MVTVAVARRLLHTQQDQGGMLRIDAVLRKNSPGSIGRVPAPELEAVVVDAIRCHLQENGTNPIRETDRELIERHLLRVTLGTKAVMLHLRVAGQDGIFAAAETTIAFPWTVPATPMKPGSREFLLIAMAKARKWMKDAERGHSFADIARREGKAERHIRHLAPLAFVSPRIITAIMEGTVPAGLTATALARGLPYSWTEQEQRMSMPQRLDCTVHNGE